MTFDYKLKNRSSRVVVPEKKNYNRKTTYKWNWLRFAFEQRFIDETLSLFFILFILNLISSCKIFKLRFFLQILVNFAK